MVHGQIDFLDHGPISKWIGPSLRGLVLQPLKDDWCQLSIEERLHRQLQMSARDSQYCLGCVKNPHCNYGTIFEPDRLMIDGQVQGGRRNGLVALTIGGRCDNFDNDDQRNESLPKADFRMMAIGVKAVESIQSILEKLIKLGQVQGIAPDRLRPGTRFNVQSGPLEWSEHLLSIDELPIQLEPTGELCSLLLEFDSPLLIKEPAGERTKHYSNSFDFPSFFSHCHRTIRRAVQEFHSPAWSRDLNFRSFFELVSEVSIVRMDGSIEEFRRRSNRRDGQPWELSGILGRYQLAHVPRVFVPWIRWAGLIGIGDSRNCGMGCFRVEIL